MKVLQILAKVTLYTGLAILTVTVAILTGVVRATTSVR